MLRFEFLLNQILSLIYYSNYNLLQHKKKKNDNINTNKTTLRSELIIHLNYHYYKFQVNI